jgi:hypothetical protein
MGHEHLGEYGEVMGERQKRHKQVPESCCFGCRELATYVESCT